MQRLYQDPTAGISNREVEAMFDQLYKEVVEDEPEKHTDTVLTQNRFIAGYQRSFVPDGQCGLDRGGRPLKGQYQRKETNVSSERGRTKSISAITKRMVCQSDYMEKDILCKRTDQHDQVTYPLKGDLSVRTPGGVDSTLFERKSSSGLSAACTKNTVSSAAKDAKTNLQKKKRTDLSIAKKGMGCGEVINVRNSARNGYESDRSDGSGFCTRKNVSRSLVNGSKKQAKISSNSRQQIKPKTSLDILTSAAVLTTPPVSVNEKVLHWNTCDLEPGNDLASAATVYVPSNSAVDEHVKNPSSAIKKDPKSSNITSATKNKVSRLSLTTSRRNARCIESNCSGKNSNGHSVADRGQKNSILDASFGYKQVHSTNLLCDGVESSTVSSKSKPSLTPPRGDVTKAKTSKSLGKKTISGNLPHTEKYVEQTASHVLKQVEVKSPVTQHVLNNLQMTSQSLKSVDKHVKKQTTSKSSRKTQILDKLETSEVSVGDQGVTTDNSSDSGIVCDLMKNIQVGGSRTHKVRDSEAGYESDSSVRSGVTYRKTASNRKITVTNHKDGKRPKHSLNSDAKTGLKNVCNTTAKVARHEHYVKQKSAVSTKLTKKQLKQCAKKKKVPTATLR